MTIDKDKCLWRRIFIKAIFASLVISSTLISINSLYTADFQIYTSKFNLFLELWTPLSNCPLDISIWVSNRHLRLNCTNWPPASWSPTTHPPTLLYSSLQLMPPLSFCGSLSQKLHNLWLLSSLPTNPTGSSFKVYQNSSASQDLHHYHPSPGYTISLLDYHDNLLTGLLASVSPEG